MAEMVRREMLENASLESFWAAFWPAPGTASGNGRKCASGKLLGGHSGLRLEMLESASLGVNWVDILVCAWKCVKMHIWANNLLASAS